MLLEQKIAFSTLIEEPTAYSDILLDEPQLVGVRAINPFTSQDGLFEDGANICTLIGYPIYFEWYEVENATNYILQICQHQEFVGPTLVTFNISSSEVSPFTASAIYKEIFAGQTIKKEKSYFWRVFALGADGSVSPKSEIWNINFKCEISEPRESSSGSGSDSGESSSPAPTCNFRQITIVDLEVSSGTGSASPPTLKYNVYNADGELVAADVSPTFRPSSSQVNAASWGLAIVEPFEDNECSATLFMAFESFQEDACT